MHFLTTFSVLAVAATAAASAHHEHARLHMRHDGAYGYNNTVTPAPNLSTGYESKPQETVAPGGTDVQVITEIVDNTLTYTLGYGSTAQVVTTTVKHTSTRTLTHVVTMTRAPSQVAEQDVPDYNANPNQNPTPSPSPEPTTTIRQTSTLTKVVTVYRNTPTAADVAAQETGVCAAPSTVYVTEQQTVYVTVPAPAASDAVVKPEATEPEVTEPEATEPEAVHTGGPKQSSEGGYYPTGGDSASSAAPTGAMPTGYVRRSFRAPIRL